MGTLMVGLVLHLVKGWFCQGTTEKSLLVTGRSPLVIRLKIVTIIKTDKNMNYICLRISYMRNPD